MRLALPILKKARDSPYRLESRPYFHLGILGEIVIGNVSLFASAENSLAYARAATIRSFRNARQAAYGRVDVWAPTEGPIVNGGLACGSGIIDSGAGHVASDRRV